MREEGKSHSPTPSIHPPTQLQGGGGGRPPGERQSERESGVGKGLNSQRLSFSYPPLRIPGNQLFFQGNESVGILFTSLGSSSFGRNISFVFLSSEGASCDMVC